MEKKYSFFATMTAIFWSFFGLRRSRDFEVDVKDAFNPLYVVIAALLGLVLFIGILLFAVRMAVS